MMESKHTEVGIHLRRTRCTLEYKKMVLQWRLAESKHGMLLKK